MHILTDIELAKMDSDRLHSINKYTRLLADIGLFKSCINCSHWIEGTQEGSLLKPEQKQLCGKFKMRPPTKIIVNGCDEHSDQIPY